MAQTLDSVQQMLINEVNKDNLMEYTKNIAKEVRLSGTEEELRSFKYVQSKLEEFGVETSLIFSDAYISLPGNAELSVNNQSFACITHTLSTPTPVDGIDGELVYVGKAISPDYQTIDVRGKVALLDGLAIPGAVAKAQQAGALATVFINAKHTHEMIVSPVWGNPTTENVNLLPKIPVASVNYGNGNKIKQLIAEHENTTVSLKTEVDTGWRKIPLLTAEIKGQEQSDDFVLFSGHIDSWHYGAMDNGSADAAMIEVARILGQHRDKLKRTLRLAFWSGHSHGRYAGSAWYCDEHWEELHDHCVMHINIDSVGGKGATILSEGNCMAETKDLAAKSIKVITNVDYEGSRFGRAGDQSFWGPGVPSLFMGLSEQPQSDDPASEAFSQLFGAGKGGGFGWWWHTTEDTVDKIDPENLERDCKIYVSIVYQACSEQLYPINQLAAVQELKDILLHYQQLAGQELSFTRSIDRITQLEEEVEAFNQFIQNEMTEQDISKVNQMIKRLSKLLVPLNYVNGNPFQHDLAMKQAPLPLLGKVGQLAAAEKGSDEYYQLKTELKRNVNQVNYTIKNAFELVQQAKNHLKKKTC
ncbi:M28 family peptidase [Alkalihalobacillus sp. BA299]|uniref:M28 family peptidase n=1 Tax=Alkalihalobacillus sp. BA299 TaxID=2815938 RepID=UPI001ADC1A34|nr:M28 family peptidase [Alkalihalobacillus sp. BA299]